MYLNADVLLFWHHLSFLQKYFAVITHQESESDKRMAKKICDFLADKDVKFTNGNGGEGHISILEKAQWNIFVLSKDTINDQLLVAKLNAAFQTSVDNDVVQVSCLDSHYWYLLKQICRRQIWGSFEIFETNRHLLMGISRYLSVPICTLAVDTKLIFLL